MKKAKGAIWLVLMNFNVCGWTSIARSQELISSATSAPISAVPTTAAGGTQVPRLVKFSGTLPDDNGQPRNGVEGITLLLYKEQTGGAPLWIETQNVNVDAKGHYIVLLGASKPDGLPTDLLTARLFIVWSTFHQLRRPRNWSTI